ncbi:MAG TPA: DUF4301 family protein [Candidatus Polarisedimenticolaceae bacterium]
MTPFNPADVDQLRERGISVEEARRQLDLLRVPPPRRRLDRPATVGDGIVRIPEERTAELIQLAELAARQGRCLKMVPASGAASRMFASLLAARAARQCDVQDSRVLMERLHDFPFLEELRSELAFEGYDLDILHGAGNCLEILDAMLGPDGLALADRPKGLLAFHRYAGGARLAFEEHLVEAAAYARDADGIARVHFTVSPEHLDRFREAAEEARPGYERGLGVRLEIGFSVQSPSTDTIAATVDGEPFRDDAGRVLLRPAGHGALLENLNALEGDLVLLKNIDNVVPDRLKGPTVRWKRILCGFLVALQREVFLHTARLRDPAVEAWALDEAQAFAAERFAAAAPSGADRRAWLLDLLDRPLRVCGVVPNQGEPGGGPFWQRGEDGRVTLQIVETAEVDLDDPSQASIVAASTHFNPVDLACSVRDVEGRPYDLRRFVDARAVLVARKSFGGRELLALERPGLWNGAMAFWNTVFVEVPVETFAPVKTVFDLLRPEHRGTV